MASAGRCRGPPIGARTTRAWLTVWEGNTNALGFHARCGFDDVGGTAHVIEGRAHGDRVLTRPVVPAEPFEDGA